MTDQAFIILVQTILALAVIAPVLLVAALSQISLFVPVTAEDVSAAPVTCENVTPLRLNLLSGAYETCTAEQILTDLVAFAPAAPVAQSYPLRAALMLLAADLYVEGLFLIGRLKATHTAAQHAWATS